MTRLSLSEARERLDLSLAEILDEISDGKLTVETEGRRILIPLAEVERYEAQHGKGRPNGRSR